MQEDEAEQDDASHHGEGTGVVGEGARDEPLVLSVFPRSHRRLQHSNILNVIYFII